jgi:AmmeMemoRadiSam system protein B
LWYPARPSTLRHEIETYLNHVTVAPPAGEIMGLVTPHAGIKYSGLVAAYAFRFVQGLTFDSVVIACPSHQHDDNVIISSGHEAYQTPLGTVPLDHATLAALEAELPSLITRIRHDQEHAIEIELPFLQTVLAAEFKLVPLMLRDQSRPLAQQLGAALAKVVAGKRVLLIASSDLSHFYTQPIAQRLDAEMLKQVGAFDPDGVLHTEAQGRGFACGYGAIATMLYATRALGATSVTVLHHATSGDVTGDYGRVVGYGAAVITK